MARFTHLLSSFAKNKQVERRNKILDSNRKEVEINGKGIGKRISLLKQR